MNKKILFLILLLIVLAPTIGVAEALGLDQVVKNAANSLKGIGGGLATIGFIVAGIMYISATGNPSKMETAKLALVAAVIGIVIILLADTAAEFVAKIFGLPSSPTPPK